MSDETTGGANTNASNYAALSQLRRALSAGLHELSARLAEHQTINRSTLDALIDEVVHESEQARVRFAKAQDADVCPVCGPSVSLRPTTTAARTNVLRGLPLRRAHILTSHCWSAGDGAGRVLARRKGLQLRLVPRR